MAQARYSPGPVYNEPAQSDVVQYQLFVSGAPFTNVAGLVPNLVLPSGTFTFTFTNLTPGQDHFFAVVAVDVNGHFNPSVTFAAAYALTADVLSREVSVVVIPQSPPAPVSPLVAAPSPNGACATLSWGAYNEIAQSDVVAYRIFVSGSPLTNVSGLTPYAIVPAGVNGITLCNLPPAQDNFFAVVAVDAAGNFNPRRDFRRGVRAYRRPQLPRGQPGGGAHRAPGPGEPPLARRSRPTARPLWSPGRPTTNPPKAASRSIGFLSARTPSTM